MNPKWIDSAKESVRLAQQKAKPSDVAGGKRTREMYTKAEVDYQHPAKGDDSCRSCVNFLSPHKCKHVMGFIRREDWCNRYKARTR